MAKGATMRSLVWNTMYMHKFVTAIKKWTNHDNSCNTKYKIAHKTILLQGITTSTFDTNHAKNVMKRGSPTSIRVTTPPRVRVKQVCIGHIIDTATYHTIIGQEDMWMMMTEVSINIGVTIAKKKRIHMESSSSLCPSLRVRMIRRSISLMGTQGG